MDKKKSIKDLNFEVLLLWGLGLLRFPLDHECALLHYFAAKFGHLGCFFLSKRVILIVLVCGSVYRLQKVNFCYVDKTKL